MNAIPGGLPVRDVMTNHHPEPKEHPGIVVVGDYLFDSTLNGLLDSSDAATDIILTQMMKLRYQRGEGGNTPSDKIDRSDFDNYRNSALTARCGAFTDPITRELIRCLNRTGTTGCWWRLGERRAGRALRERA